jgi:hypothetical protein
LRSGRDLLETEEDVREADGDYEWCPRHATAAGIADVCFVIKRCLVLVSLSLPLEAGVTDAAPSYITHPTTRLFLPRDMQQLARCCKQACNPVRIAMVTQRIVPTDQIGALESATFNQDTLKTMKAGADALKKANNNMYVVRIEIARSHQSRRFSRLD